jgi:hypothetical protein
MEPGPGASDPLLDSAARSRQMLIDTVEAIR